MNTNTKTKSMLALPCAGAGGIAGAASAIKGGTAGATLGTALLPGIGTAIGGLGGLFAGFLTGAFSGHLVGNALDRHVIRRYRCLDCGHEF